MRPKNLEKEQAIRTVALQIISEEGLENLSMQKLAKAAGISPRTIYIKYRDKEDLLIRLFIEEVLAAYETAVLKDFNESMEFAEGIKKLWLNSYAYLKAHRAEYALMQYGTSSPLLNKAYQENNIRQGRYFAPIQRFLKLQVRKGVIKEYPHDVHRALLFSPLFTLIREYFDHQQRPKQIITEKLVLECCATVIKGMLK